MLKINPAGDLLALAASCSWASYSILLKRVGRGHHPVYVTRKTFFYGLISIAILLWILRPVLRPASVIKPPLLAHLAFLAVIASSLCFVMWSKAVRLIGIVNTSNYIYLVPLITAVSAALFLREQVTVLTVLGGVMVLGGVYLAGKTVDARPLAPTASPPQRVLKPPHILRG